MVSMTDGPLQQERSKMATSFHPDTAKIYTFPARGRFAAGARPELADDEFDLKSARYSDAAFGGSWYHEEAIKEADHNQKQ
jgi:hypothetical protein